MNHRVQIIQAIIDDYTKISDTHKGTKNNDGSDTIKMETDKKVEDTICLHKIGSWLLDVYTLFFNP